MGADQGEWHVVVEGEQMGPYPTGDMIAWLQEGRLTPGMLCWRAGMEEWQPIGAMPELSLAAVTSKPKKEKKKKRAREKRPPLTAAQKRTILKAAAIMLTLILACVAAVMAYYRMGLNHPTVTRNAHVLYKQGNYVGSWRTVRAYLQEAKMLDALDVDLDTAISMDAATLQRRFSGKRDADALLLYARLIADHAPEICVAGGGMEWPIRENETRDGVTVSVRVPNHDNPAMILLGAVAINPRVRSKAAALAADVIEKSLSQTEKELWAARIDCAAAAVEKNHFALALAMLQMDARASKTEHPLECAFSMAKMLHRVAPEKYERFQKQIGFPPTIFPSELPPDTYTDALNALLTSLAARLDSLAENPGMASGLAENGVSIRTQLTAASILASFAIISTPQFAPGITAAQAALMRVFANCCDPVESMQPTPAVCVTNWIMAVKQSPDACIAAATRVMPCCGAFTEALLRECRIPGGTTSPRNPLSDQHSALIVPAAVSVYAGAPLQWDSAKPAAAPCVTWSDTERAAIYKILKQVDPSLEPPEAAAPPIIADRRGRAPGGPQQPGIGVSDDPAPEPARSEADNAARTEAERIHRLEVEIRRMYTLPSLDATPFDLHKARRDCAEALRKAQRESALAPLAAEIQAVIDWIALAEEPEKRFVFVGHMSSGDNALLRIQDNLDGRVYSIRLGEQIHGYRFTEKAPDNTSVTFTAGNETFKIYRR